jgi:hypothetical protein
VELVRYVARHVQVEDASRQRSGADISRLRYDAAARILGGGTTKKATDAALSGGAGAGKRGIGTEY